MAWRQNPGKSSSVHLRHDGGGHLDEVHAALVGRCGKSGHVANHAAAQGNEGGVAVQPAGEGEKVRGGGHMAGVRLQFHTSPSLPSGKYSACTPASTQCPESHCPAHCCTGGCPVG